MIQIGEKPSPTFASPLELMSDCHRRVEKFLRALIIVTDQAKGGALTDLQREELQAALRYFREAAPKHTADEEDSLFPRMRKIGSEEIESALKKIEALEADHKTANVSHDIVERLGRKWLTDDRLNDDETGELTRELKKLADIYSDHIRVEDHEVFPIARKALSPAELREIGTEMAERRGQPFRE